MSIFSVLYVSGSNWQYIEEVTSLVTTCFLGIMTKKETVLQAYVKLCP